MVVELSAAEEEALDACALCGCLALEGLLEEEGLSELQGLLEVEGPPTGSCRE